MTRDWSHRAQHKARFDAQAITKIDPDQRVIAVGRRRVQQALAIGLLVALAVFGLDEIGAADEFSDVDLGGLKIEAGGHHHHVED